MVFQKYNDDEERLAALRGQKNLYAKKPDTCEFCNVTILKATNGSIRSHINMKKYT